MIENQTDKTDSILNDHVGMVRLSPDIWFIISAIAQLERDLISERVKNGLANARAKGKLIGRKKLRDSDLIRKLLKSGLTYRAVASIAKCSHGSVHQEKLAMKKDEALAEKKRLEELAKIMTTEKPIADVKTVESGPNSTFVEYPNAS